VCSGNCGNRDHRRNYCQAAVVTIGASHCKQCLCQWLGCSKPRTWKGYCHRHSNFINDLSDTWKTVLAAKNIAKLLLPCDVPSFIAFYRRYRHCLPALVVAAFLKEPAALSSLEDQATSSGRKLDEPYGFRDCWVKVIAKLSVGILNQRFVELQQLTRNGAGRMSCIGPTLRWIGILEPDPDADDADASPDVRLGLTRRPYKVLSDDGIFQDFWKEFADETWPRAVAAQSFASFCSEVRALLQQIAKRTQAFGLASEKYCFHFLYRKLLIGESSFRRDDSTSFAAVDWDDLTVGDLKFLSADKNEHLSDFDDMEPAAGLSDFFFGRSDWPLFLSAYACLWHEAVEYMGDDVCELAGSESVHGFARSWRQRNSINPHPSVLLTEYRLARSGDPEKKNAASKKRPASQLTISISDV